VRRPGRAPARLIAVALGGLLGSSGGCSWTFTKPLPDHPSPLDEPDCSNSLVPPVIDLLLSLSNVVTGTYLATQDNEPYKYLRVTAGLTAAGVWLSSAIYGFSHTHACQAARDDFMHGYHPPAFGTGGEVFTPPPPPPRPVSPDAGPPGG
jgi:hypothetical protein